MRLVQRTQACKSSHSLCSHSVFNLKQIRWRKPKSTDHLNRQRCKVTWQKVWVLGRVNRPIDKIYLAQFFKSYSFLLPCLCHFGLVSKRFLWHYFTMFVVYFLSHFCFQFSTALSCSLFFLFHSILFLSYKGNIFSTSLKIFIRVFLKDF